MESFESEDEEEKKEIIDSFADKKANYAFLEGECHLKTKSDKFKRHWAVLMGNEIYCYRNQNDAAHRVMHCLVGTYIKELVEEHSPTSRRKLYPLKIMLPPNKSRILYFNSQKEQINWS
mmetsp:Transcript_30742/g.30230  ORF Transcript_30742/g.30230 Transcript_30742/m.30230 type:complete len:119 (+) Transcript_30742:1156-1512(+)